jgi:hypothetical protein
MTYKNLLALAFPIALVLACGGGGDRKQSFVPHQPGTGGAAGAAGAAGSAGSSGMAGSSGSAGSAGSAGAPADAGTTDSGESDGGTETDGEVVLPDTLCPTTFTRNNEASLPLSGSGNERFGSITDDELTIAYTIPNGAYGQVFVASRANANTASFVGSHPASIPNRYPSSIAA